MCFSFLESGSDIIETVSYQASVEGFLEYLGVTEHKAMQLIKNSVELARRACEEVAEANSKTSPSSLCFTFCFNIINIEDIEVLF